MDFNLKTNWVFPSGTRKYAIIELQKARKISENKYLGVFNSNNFLKKVSFFNLPFPITKKHLDFIIAKKCIESLSNWKDLASLKESYINKIDLKFASDDIKCILTENLKEALYSIILLSRTTDLVNLAASNAITFLNKSDFVFKNLDLSRISIPNVDLSYGLFINTNFEYSNLSGVNFSKSQIYDSNFRNCNMTNTFFGQQAPLIILNAPAEILVFSPCGRFFATSSYETVYLYDSQKYQLITDFFEHEEQVKFLLFSDNGNYLVSAGSDAQIILWSMDTKLKLNSFANCNKFASFSPCSTYLCFSKNLYEGIVIIYDIDSCQISQKIYNIEIPKFAFFLSSIFVVFIENLKINKWDLLAKEKVNIIRCPKSFSAFKVSLCRKYLAISDGYNVISIYNVEIFELIETFSLMPFSYFTFSTCGRYLAVKLRNYNIETYSLANQSKCFEILNKNNIMGLEFSSLGNYLVYGTSDGTLESQKMAMDLNLNKKILIKHGFTAVSFSLDNLYFAAGTEDGWIFIFFLENQKLFKKFRAHMSSISCISWSVSVIASSSMDFTIKIWDISSNFLLKVFYMSMSPASWFQFSPDEKKILLCTFSGSTAIIDIDTGQVSNQMKINRQQVSMCCWSRCGKFIITCSSEQSINIWKWENQELVANFTKYNQDAELIRLSPLEDLLVSSSLDKNIKIWYIGDTNDRFQGNYVRKEFYVENVINSIVWLSDGKNIIAGDKQGQILVFDEEKIIRNEYVHKKEYAVALDASRRGNFVVSCSLDMTVKLWWFNYN